MRRLQRGQDALGAREPPERVERRLVTDVRVFGPPEIAQPRVLGTDSGVVEPRRD